MARNGRAVLTAFVPLTFGHFLAMLVVLLPFALLSAIAGWRREIQIGAALLVIAFGVFRLLNRRHPRALARIKPTELGLWSFAIAIAHGAGLMLVPIYLGLCSRADGAHAAEAALVQSDLRMAVAVSLVHSAAMLLTAGSIAWLVYRYLGVRFVAQSWFNLDAVWAMSLIVVGAVSLVIVLTAAA